MSVQRYARYHFAPQMGGRKWFHLPIFFDAKIKNCEELDSKFFPNPFINLPKPPTFF